MRSQLNLFSAQPHSLAASASKFLPKTDVILSSDPGLAPRALRRRELMARAAAHRSNGPMAPLHLWPEPERISPVHPAWDIPRNKRLRVGVITSLVFHLIAIPVFLLGTKIDFSIFGKPIPEERLVGRIQLVALPPVKGQGGVGLRPIQNEPPPRPPEKPPDNRVHPKPAAPKPAVTKPSNSKPEPTVDPTVSRPVPVPDQATKPIKKPSDNAPRPTTPAINNDVIEGPLLVGKGPVPGSEASIGGLNGVDFPYNYYLELLRTKIAQAWKVPPGSVPPGKKATALVTFRIQRDGKVSRSTLVEPSGRSDFDQSASRAIVDAQPFPPLPPAFGGQFLVVNFQFAYQGQ
ncbi:MAG: energy transducer TonB [Candidatus Eisenbacteria bacterium]|nr:energy transducer TonB [Candidatus Eisenbacteria bacterium]